MIIRNVHVMTIYVQCRNSNYIYGYLIVIFNIKLKYENIEILTRYTYVNATNFEVFGWAISLSIDLLFLETTYVTMLISTTVDLESSRRIEVL